MIVCVREVIYIPWLAAGKEHGHVVGMETESGRSRPSTRGGIRRLGRPSPQLFDFSTVEHQIPTKVGLAPLQLLNNCVSGIFKLGVNSPLAIRKGIAPAPILQPSENSPVLIFVTETALKLLTVDRLLLRSVHHTGGVPVR